MPSKDNVTTIKYSLEELRNLQDSVCAKFRPAYFESQFVNDEGLFDPEVWFDNDRYSFRQRETPELRRRHPRPPSRGLSVPIHDNGDFHLEHRINLDTLFYSNNEKRPKQAATNEPGEILLQSVTQSDERRKVLQEMNKDEAGKHLLQLLHKPSSKPGAKHVRINDPPTYISMEMEDDLQFLSKSLREAVLGNITQNDQEEKTPNILTLEEIEANLLRQGSKKSQTSNVRNSGLEDQSAFYRLLGSLHSRELENNSKGVTPTNLSTNTTTNNNHSARQKVFQETSCASTSPSHPVENRGKTSLLQTPPFRDASDNVAYQTSGRGDNRFHDTGAQMMSPMHQLPNKVRITTPYSPTPTSVGINGPSSSVSTGGPNSAFRWYRAMNNAASAKSRISSLLPGQQVPPNVHNKGRETPAKNIEPITSSANAHMSEPISSRNTPTPVSQGTLNLNTLPEETIEISAPMPRQQTSNGSIFGFGRGNGFPPGVAMGVRGMMGTFPTRPMGMGMGMGMGGQQSGFLNPASLSYYYYRLAQIAASTGLMSSPGGGLNHHGIRGPSAANSYPSSSSSSSLFMNNTSSYFNEASPALVARYMQHKENLASYLLRPNQLQSHPPRAPAVPMVATINDVGEVKE